LGGSTIGYLTNGQYGEGAYALGSLGVAGLSVVSGKSFAQWGSIQKIGRQIYDARPFSTISREYWRLNGPANGASLHHWLFPQRATFIPVGVRNAGFNLIRLPAMRGVFHQSLGLNQWMGFARNWNPSAARNAAIVEHSIRIGYPTAVGGAAYGAYQVVNSGGNN
jgi:hypothetical protein